MKFLCVSFVLLLSTLGTLLLSAPSLHAAAKWNASAKVQPKALAQAEAWGLAPMNLWAFNRDPDKRLLELKIYRAPTSTGYPAFIVTLADSPLQGPDVVLDRNAYFKASATSPLIAAFGRRGNADNVPTFGPIFSPSGKRFMLSYEVRYGESDTLAFNCDQLVHDGSLIPDNRGTADFIPYRIRWGHPRSFFRAVAPQIAATDTCSAHYCDGVAWLDENRIKLKISGTNCHAGKPVQWNGDLDLSTQKYTFKAI